MSSPPPLALVDCSVLRVAPSLHALPHVADHLTSFLDPSPLCTPAKAATTGSLPLLVLVIQQYEAAGVEDAALDIAIQNDDLAMVQKIHALHPEPLALRSLVVAFNWRRESCDKCAVRAFREIGPRDTLRIIEWCYERGLFNPGHRDSESVVSSTMLQSLELFDWYASLGLLQNHAVGRVICDAIFHGNYDLAPLLRRILQNASAFSSRADVALPVLIYLGMEPGQEDYVELLLASVSFQHLKDKVVFARLEDGCAKVLQWDIEFMKRTRIDYIDMPQWIADAAQACARIDTMRWLLSTRLVKTFSPPVMSMLPEDKVLGLHTWLMENNAGYWGVPYIQSGSLALMQWYHANCRFSFTAQVMDYAAQNGHLHIVKWLHENRSEGCTRAATADAAYAGYLEVVQWLFQNRTEGDTNLAMARAVLGGHLDIVMGLCANRSDACPACVLEFVLGSVHRIEDTPLLYTLQWLDTHPSRRDGCDGQCCIDWPNSEVTVTDLALRVGDVQLLTYLQAHHPERLRALVHRNYELASSHIGRIQWAFMHQNDKYDWQAVRNAAAYSDSTRTAEWLDSVLESRRQISD